MKAETTSKSGLLASLKGAGPKTLEKLARIGIHNIEDLLLHLPIRYEDKTKLTPIGRLQANTSALFEGEVVTAGVVYGKRRSYVCKLQQEFSVITVRLFHFSAAQTRRLQSGVRLRCYGDVRFGPNGLECVHPEYTVLSDSEDLPLATSLTPVYSSTEGLHQASLRRLLDQALDRFDSSELSEGLPDQVLQRFKDSIPSGTASLSTAQCLLALHRPRSAILAHLESYRQRLALEELLAHHLSLMQMRQRLRKLKAPPLQRQSDLVERFTGSLSFELTSAQCRVCRELQQDLASTAPTLRLVQGDVGSGKTVVAALAALLAIDNGYQAALMAPTEILAEQHCRNFQLWMQPLGINIAFLSGQLKAGERRTATDAIGSGHAHLIIGTHALIQDSVDYRNLGLLIIDEQHRFGVNQRLSLRQKAEATGICPHQIIMTATPIPRTLAMTAYADLDVSVIDELPPGRTPVQTSVLESSQRAKVVQRIHQACRSGRQAYWVCTLIEESETLQCQAAEKTCEELRIALPDLSIGLVHGRQKASDKAAVMQSFKLGELQLLVATTVIEVGVDVPNASLMVIDNAERLGLSQIHQLRGRVGRGDTDSYCVLIYQKPLSANGRKRLEVLRSSSDGFLIAEEDLKLRGPGEVLGTRQTGMLQFRIANLERDSNLLEVVQKMGEFMVERHPLSIEPLIQRWIGEARSYQDV